MVKTQSYLQRESEFADNLVAMSLKLRILFLICLYFGSNFVGDFLARANAVRFVGNNLSFERNGVVEGLFDQNNDFRLVHFIADGRQIKQTFIKIEGEEISSSAKLFKASSDKLIIVIGKRSVPSLYLVSIPDLKVEKILFPTKFVFNNQYQSVDVSRIRVTSPGPDLLCFLIETQLFNYVISQKNWNVLNSENSEILTKLPLYKYPFFGHQTLEKLFLWGPGAGFIFWHDRRWHEWTWNFEDRALQAIKDKSIDSQDVLFPEHGFLSYSSGSKYSSVSSGYLLFIPKESLPTIDENSNLESFFIRSLPITERTYQPETQSPTFSHDGRCIFFFDSTNNVLVFDRLENNWAVDHSLEPQNHLQQKYLYLDPFYYLIEPEDQIKNNLFLPVPKRKTEIACPGKATIDVNQFKLLRKNFAQLFLDIRTPGNVELSQPSMDYGSSSNRIDKVQLNSLIISLIWVGLFCFIGLGKLFIFIESKVDLKVREDEDDDTEQPEHVVIGVFEKQPTKSEVEKKPVGVRNGYQYSLTWLGLFLYLSYLIVLSGSRYYAANLENNPYLPMKGNFIEKMFSNFFLDNALLLVLWPFAVLLFALSRWNGKLIISLLIPVGLGYWSSSYNTVPLGGSALSLWFTLFVLIFSKVLENLWRLAGGSLVFRIGVLLLPPLIMSVVTSIPPRGPTERKEKLDHWRSVINACALFSEGSEVSDCGEYIGTTNTEICETVPASDRPSICFLQMAAKNKNVQNCIKSNINADSAASCIMKYSALKPEQCAFFRESPELQLGGTGTPQESLIAKEKLEGECRKILQDSYDCKKESLSYSSESLCETVKALKNKDVGLCPKPWQEYIQCHRQINLVIPDRPLLSTTRNSYINEPFCEDSASSPICLARLNAISGTSQYCDILSDNRTKAACHYLGLLTRVQTKGLSDASLKDQCQIIGEFLPELKGKCLDNVRQVLGLK